MSQRHSVTKRNRRQVSKGRTKRAAQQIQKTIAKIRTREEK
jgi:hypothetical protein